MLSRLPVFAITGASGNGKTTVLEQLIHALAERGWRMMACKDCSSPFELDRPGSDSARLGNAGSEAVWLQGKGRWALLAQAPPRCPAPGCPPPDGPSLTPQGLAGATAALYVALGYAPPDLILVEGFHSWDVPSAHVLGPRNRPAGPGCLAHILGPLLAPGTEAEAIAAAGSPGSDRDPARRLPVFRWDDGPGLAVLVEKAVGLRRPDGPSRGPDSGPPHRPGDGSSDLA